MFVIGLSDLHPWRTFDWCGKRLVLHIRDRIFLWSASCIGLEALLAPVVSQCKLEVSTEFNRHLGYLLMLLGLLAALIIILRKWLYRISLFQNQFFLPWFTPNACSLDIFGLRIVISKACCDIDLRQSASTFFVQTSLNAWEHLHWSA